VVSESQCQGTGGLPGYCGREATAQRWCQRQADDVPAEEVLDAGRAPPSTVSVPGSVPGYSKRDTPDEDTPDGTLETVTRDGSLGLGDRVRCQDTRTSGVLEFRARVGEPEPGARILERDTRASR
jgi:hypothetical protein